jgi:hypothetical protein
MSAVKITPAGSAAKAWVDDMNSGDSAKVEAGKAAWAALPEGVKRGWQTNADVLQVLGDFGLETTPSAPAEGARRRKSRRATRKTKKVARRTKKTKASRRR